MKILMILEKEFPPDERVENEIKILEKIGHEIILVCTSKSKPTKNDYFSKSRVLRVYMPNYIYKSSVLVLLIPVYFNYWNKKISTVLRNYSIDFIHIHDLPLASVGYKLAKKYKKKIILDLHENRPEIMRMYKHINTFPLSYLVSIKRWNNYQKEYVKKADKVIVVSTEAREYYKEVFSVNTSNIHVLPNYIDTDKFTPKSIKHEKKDGKLFCVYFGDTAIRRGTLTILKTANYIKDKNIEFVIIGWSKEQKILENFISDNNISNVTLTGWLDVEKAFSLIKNCDIGLCPFLRNIHHDTTYANKMFQYLALGLPVIVSDCTAQANFVNSEQVGLVFKAGEYKSLADSIVKMKEQINYVKLGIKAQNIIFAKYNWNNLIVELESIYKS